MAKDTRNADGPDPKDVQKSMKDYGKFCDTTNNTLGRIQKLLEENQSISESIAKDATKQGQKDQMERFKLMQDNQTKIMELMQDVTTNKSKAADKAMKSWDGFIRG